MSEVEIKVQAQVENQKEIVELKQEIIKLGQSSLEVDKQVEELSTALNDLARAEELKQKLSETSEALEDTTSNVDKAKEALARAREEALLFSKDADPKQLKELNKTISDQEKELKKLEQAQEKARKKYEDTNNALNSSSQNVKKLISDNAYLEQTLNQTAVAQDKLNAELGNLKDVGDAYKKLGVKDLEKEIEELENAYKTLKESGKLSASELRDAHNKLTEEVEKYKKALDGTDEAYKQLKKGAIQFLPVAAALKKVTGTAIEYEEAMADVKKVITATDEEINELSNSLIQMSKTIPVSAKGLAEIAAAGAQLGVSVGNLKSFVRITADMATAFDMLPKDAGKAIASLSNIFGIAINDTEKLGDAINHLSNNSAAEAKQIVDVLVKIGATGKAIGLTEVEVAALGSTLIAFGKSPEIAGTAVDAFLTRLQMLNTLGPTGQEALDRLGISAVEMSQKIKEDASDAIVYFLEKVNDLQSDKAGTLTSIFGRGPQADILLMASNVNQLKNQLNLVGDASKYLGSMQNEAKSRAETTANQLQLMKNNIDALSMSLGVTLLPILNQFAKGVTSVVDSMESFATANPQIAKTALLIGTAMASINLMSASMKLLQVQSAKTFAVMNAGFLKVAGSADKAAVATKAVKSAVAVLAAAFTGMEIGTYLRENFKIAELAGISLMATLHSASVGIGKSLTAIKKWLMMDFSGAIDELKTLKESVSEVFKGYVDLYEQAEKEESISNQRKGVEELAQSNEKLEQSINRVRDSNASLALTKKDLKDITQKEADEILRLNELLERQGTSYNAIELGITKTGEEAIRIFTQTANNAASTSKIIRDSFVRNLSEISTGKEFDLLKAEFENIKNSAKLSADDMKFLTASVNELDAVIKNGTGTTAEFEKAQKAVVETMKAHIDGNYKLNDAISKQIGLYEQQIEQNKRLADAQITKLEAEKKLAQAQNETYKAKQLEEQIDKLRIQTMREESDLLSKITEEKRKELNILLQKKESGKQLTEEEKARVDVLRNEIIARELEADAIKTAAKAKEIDTNASNENASAIKKITVASQEASNAVQGVATQSQDAEKKVSGGWRKGGSQSWLKGVADEAKMSSEALDQLKGSVDQMNKVIIGGASTGNFTGLKKLNESHALLTQNIAKNINQFEELEAQIGSTDNATLSQIKNWQGLAGSIQHVDKAQLSNLQKTLKDAEDRIISVRQNAEQTLRSLDQQISEARGRDDMNAFKDERNAKVLELEKQRQEIQKTGDAEAIRAIDEAIQKQKVLNNLEIRQERERRTAIKQAQIAERSKQKIDINLNGKNLEGLNLDDPKDKEKITKAVVETIEKSRDASTSYYGSRNRIL